MIKKIIAAAVIALLMLVSSLKVLDNYADEYTTQAITAAAVSYATARGINALVSMMQTTTIEAGVGFSGSISIGELLDPLNDLIERYSSVMTLVLGSLAGQKVLLLIASHQLFQFLVVLLGLASIVSVLLNKTTAFGVILKSFLILVFIRFSLGIAVALNAVVDASFLVDQTRSYENEIEVLRQDMSSLNSESGVSVEQIQSYRVDLQRLIDEQQQLAQSIIRLNNEKDKQEQALQSLTAQMDSQRAGLSPLDKLNPFNEDLSVSALQQEIQLAQENRERLIADLQRQQSRLQAVAKQMLSLDKKSRGEADGFFERIKKKSAAVMNSFDIDAIEQKVNRNISNFMNLMALYILKTIVFPLLFFYLLLVVLKRIWRINL